MEWSTIQQLIRIVLYSVGAFLFGQAAADGEMFQAAINGSISVFAFVWWAMKERGVVK